MLRTTLAMRPLGRMPVKCRYMSSNSKFPPIPTEGNVPPSIKEKIGKNLHLTPTHPLNFIKRKIESYFKRPCYTEGFNLYDNLNPTVTVTQNFDDLLFPNDHIGRSPNDTYYLSKTNLLRTHTSAHQADLFRKNERAFLVTGDVYRRDSIDSVHYPIFHQMEGAKLFSSKTLLAERGGAQPVASNLSLEEYYTNVSYKTHPEVHYVETDLKKTLEGLVYSLFGNVQIRWVDAYFPFTTPSWELEIFFKNEWLEVLGCGVIHPTILQRCGISQERGWAFGLGLERLAMVLFDIPDIRLFWTDDKRFHKQFEALVGTPEAVDLRTIKFAPYSKYPHCFKDISFWVPEGFHENQFYELVRTVAGDLCEDVRLVDSFVHPKTGKQSHCYRINYRSMDRSLTNEEVDVLQNEIRDLVVQKLGVTVRGGS